MPTPRLVSTLLGHAQVGMALRCLRSLLDHSVEALRLRVHDDGSLTGEDLERLAAGLGEPAVLSRREADDRLAGWLAARPAARAFRAANPLALKLLDVALLAPGGELAYCDADVLFLRPFSGLFELPGAAGALFMRDPQNAYSVRSWQLALEPRLRLAAHVNSGVIAFHARCFDADLVEWFLSRPQYRFAPVWLEQTCWALLAQPAGCRLLDPASVAIPVPGKPQAGREVALHFVSPVRALLDRYPRIAADDRTAPAGPVALRSFAATRLTAPALAATEARRRLRRILALPRLSGRRRRGTSTPTPGG